MQIGKMQIVIEIPEVFYEALKQTDIMVSGQRSGKTLMSVIYNAVANGAPLPKGHGRLIDADNIKTAFPSGEYVRTESVRATIDHEETIIEADTESEE